MENTYAIAWLMAGVLALGCAQSPDDVPSSDAVAALPSDGRAVPRSDALAHDDAVPPEALPPEGVRKGVPFPGRSLSQENESNDVRASANVSRRTTEELERSVSGEAPRPWRLQVPTADDLHRDTRPLRRLFPAISEDGRIVAFLFDYAAANCWPPSAVDFIDMTAPHGSSNERFGLRDARPAINRRLAEGRFRTLDRAVVSTVGRTLAPHPDEPSRQIVGSRTVRVATAAGETVLLSTRAHRSQCGWSARKAWLDRRTGTVILRWSGSPCGECCNCIAAQVEEVFLTRFGTVRPAETRRYELDFTPCRESP